MAELKTKSIHFTVALHDAEHTYTTPEAIKAFFDEMSTASEDDGTLPIRYIRDGREIGKVFLFRLNEGDKQISIEADAIIYDERLMALPNIYLEEACRAGLLKDFTLKINKKRR